MTLTRSDAEATLRRLCTDHPTRQNPVNARQTCVNTDPADPTRHCLAAQVLVEHGYELPPADGPLNARTVTDLAAEGLLPGVDQDALKLLRHAQQYADWPSPWGKVLQQLDNGFLS